MTKLLSALQLEKLTSAQIAALPTGTGRYPPGSMVYDTTINDAKINVGTDAAQQWNICCFRRHSARAKQITPQSVGGPVLVVLDGEDWDTDGYHDVSTNNSRLTIPAGLGGLYLFTANVMFPNPSEGQELAVGIRKNGTGPNIAEGGNPGQTTETSPFWRGASASIEDVAAAGDYYEILTNQSHSPSGGALNLVSATFSCQLISS